MQVSKTQGLKKRITQVLKSFGIDFYANLAKSCKMLPKNLANKNFKKLCRFWGR
ncbi:hypothetical protein [Helicobacter sp. T3_23-1056]